MVLEIDPKLLDLTHLFAGRIFKIPQYQRSYSWGKKHRQDLLNDIKSSFKKKRRHFMATVVGLKQGEPVTIVAKEYQDIDIVDGQQRITTLIILYKAISKALGETDNEKKVKQDLHETLVKYDATVLLLQTNHDTSNYFSNYIREGIHDPPNQAKTSADRNLLEAIDDCEKFVEEWKNNRAELMNLIGHINNKIKFVYHEIDSESLVYSVFEVLNSRGLEVSWFDRLKSMLMNMVFDQKCNTPDKLQAIHACWSRIFGIMGTLQVSSEILRFAATLWEPESKILSDDKSVTSLIKRSEGGCAKITATVDWIERVAQSVVSIRMDKREFPLNKIAQTRLVAVAIDLRNDLTEDEKVELHSYCSKVAFCIYGICRKDARTAVGKYVRLAYDINHGKISTKQIKTSLASIVDSDEVNKQIELLAKNDCYNKWQEELRYILFRYEEYLSKDSGQNISTNEQWSRIWGSSASKTIEHIRPQSFGGDYVHYLGNLFLLPPGINSKLGDRRPADKVEEYSKTGFVMAQDIIKSLPKWNKSKIRERGEKIVQWVRTEWALPRSKQTPV